MEDVIATMSGVEVILSSHVLVSLLAQRPDAAAVSAPAASDIIMTSLMNNSALLGQSRESDQQLK